MSNDWQISVSSWPWKHGNLLRVGGLVITSPGAACRCRVCTGVVAIDQESRDFGGQEPLELLVRWKSGSASIPSACTRRDLKLSNVVETRPTGADRLHDCTLP